MKLTVVALFCILTFFGSTTWAQNAPAAQTAPQAPAPNRAKRFAAFGSLSTVAGLVGCVVSQNKLFINGHFVKDLDEDEATELDTYKNALSTFKEQVKQYLEQRQAQIRAGPGQQQQQQQPLEKPKPPKKPSFCSDKATTQYVFDGCSVQGDNMYIGNTFVRKLSAAEQQELEQFDREFTAYQKAITADFRKKVEAAFGEHFGSLFGISGAGGEQPQSQNKSAVAEVDNAEGAAANLKAPKTPNFCTLIV